MIKLRLRQPGQPDVTHEIPGDCATIGRDSTCNVPINQPFVSKQHCRIYKGLVVVDLNSRNGTFVDGVRIQQPTSLRGGKFELSKDKLEVTIETDDDGLDDLQMTVAASAPRLAASDRDQIEPRAASEKPQPVADASAASIASVRAELERERQRVRELESEAAALRARGAQSESGVQARQLELEQDNLDLRRRLETLRTGMEKEAEGKGDEPLAKLLQEQVQTLRAQNEDLRRRATEREGGSAGASNAVAPPPNAPPAMFASLQSQLRECRAKLISFETGAASSGNAPVELFGRLQSENQRLRRRVAELEAGSVGVDDADRPRTSPEIEELRARIAVADAENRRLRGEQGPRAVRAPSSAPGTYAILRRLVDDTLDDENPSLDLASEDFVVLESLRCLRRVERLSTGLASEAIDLYERHTLLPNVQGNLRTIASAVLADADRKNARGELRRYLDRVERWLQSSEICWRRAARDLVLALKQEVSAEGLTAGRPIPALDRISFRRETELWKRSNEHWNALSEKSVVERLESLWRESVERVVESGGPRT